jgi:phosphoenolpyruvate phosphomutase
MERLGGEVIEIPYTKGISDSSLKEEIDALGVTPQARLSSLRRLISAKPVVRILESHNGLTGLIAEHTSVEVNGQHREFDGMWASSLTDSTSKGKPDIEAVDLTTRLHDLNDTLEVTTKPFIFDGDTGGKIEHFGFTVRTLERLGISAVIIEDKVGLKQNSLFGTDAIQTQDTIEGFCNKIKAGKEAQITRDFMIISRCESLIAGKSVDDALERCLAYVSAGADGVMIHSKNKSGEDIKEFCLRFREKDPHTPIVAVPTTYNQFTEAKKKLEEIVQLKKEENNAILKNNIAIVNIYKNNLKDSYDKLANIYYDKNNENKNEIIKDTMNLLEEKFIIN